jgi:predicted GNAT family acetyltransferase
MEIIQKNYDNNGGFYAIENEIKIGEMTYSWAGNDKIIIDHTHVVMEYTDRGIGKNLLMKAVDFARENNIKIIPLCPFASSVFKKEAEIRDVLFN